MPASPTFGGRDMERALYFRALMDLGTGGVAGIEAALARHIRGDASSAQAADWCGRSARAHEESLSAWGREVRDPDFPSPGGQGFQIGRAHV